MTRAPVALPPRGSANLIGSLIAGESTTNAATFIPLDRIEIVKGHNPRSAFSGEDAFSQEVLADFTGSIRDSGVLQPILVRAVGNGRYHLIAGERRYWGATYAGLRVIPAVIARQDASPEKLALIENGQTEPLGEVDEALAVYHYLAGCTGQSVGRIPGLLISIKNTREDPYTLQDLMAGVLGRRGRSLTTWGQHKAPVLKLNEDEIKVIHNRLLPMKPVLLLPKLAALPQERARLLQEAVEHRWSTEHLSEQIEQVLNASKAGRPVNGSVAVRNRVKEIGSALRNYNRLPTEQQTRVNDLLDQLGTLLNPSPT